MMVYLQDSRVTVTRPPAPETDKKELVDTTSFSKLDISCGKESEWCKANR